MSEKFKWLQFFADGAAGGDGDGGDGAETGVETGAADRTLEELGVPRDKAERYRARKAKSSARAETPPQDQGNGNGRAAPQGPSWDDFMAIPENKQKLQNMMAERGRSATEAKAAADAQMEKLDRVYRLLTEVMGIGEKGLRADAAGGRGSRTGITAAAPLADRRETGPETADAARRTGVYDTDAIVKAVTDDDSYYEDKALELGVTTEVARQLDQADAYREQQQREQARQQREAQLQEHFNKRQAQADSLKKLYPDFDLQRELQNPEFVRRTAPGSGMSVEDAFYSLHHGEVMQQQAEQIALRARADAAAGFRANQARPRENGSSATGAVQAEPNLRAMTHEQRVAYIKAKYPRP